VEDIETSYWGKSEIYGYQFNSRKNGIISKFIDLVDIINNEFSGKSSKKLTLEFAEDVEMVTFAQNCIILLKKDFDSFSDFYNRDYRFQPLKNSRKSKLFGMLKRLKDLI